MNKEKIKPLIQEIETREQTKWELIQESMNTIWYIGPNDSEFRIASLGDYSIIISRISFQNKRKGTMTYVFEYLKNLCQKEKIQEIVIQSVLTKEMANWCLKNGFQCDKNTAIYINDFWSGDYKIKI